MSNEVPFHLLLPLAASLVFVFGLMLVKKANSYGISPWTVTFCANMIAAILFQSYLFAGSHAPENVASTGIVAAPVDSMQMLGLIWQPATVAVLYIMGQVFTFSAISQGDVSVATPIFSAKVLLVAFLLTFVAGEQVPAVIWAAAGLATFGIALVQISGNSNHRRIWFTIAFALAAASSFAMHDVLVQNFSPHWARSRFLPIMFAVAGILSLALLPIVQNPFRMELNAQLVLLGGALCIAIQAMCIISSLFLFGDAARVNIVYALRGLWGVLLAFLLAKQFGSAEALLTRKFMVMRFVGAALLTIAVILAIAAQYLLQPSTT